MTIPFEHRLVMTCRLASLFLLVRETAAVCMTCNYHFVISLFLQFDRTCIYIYVLQTCRAFVFCVPSDRCVLHEITLLFQTDLFSYSHTSTVYIYMYNLLQMYDIWLFITFCLSFQGESSFHCINNIYKCYVCI